LTFVLAPLPNALFAHCGSDELSSNYEGSAPVDFGRFITSMFVVTGFALPIVLAHSNVIDPKACVMSIIGGGWATFKTPHFWKLTIFQTGLCNDSGIFSSLQPRRI
jgi:hypothetical protein